MKRYLSLLGACGLVVALGLTARADEQKWGTVKGKVTFAGAVPVPQMINPDKDQGHCLSKGNLFKDELVVNKKNSGVRYALVWLAPMNAGDKLPVHPDLKEIKVKQVVIDQPCCMFEPHMLAIREGQQVVVKNSAPVAHNVNYKGVKNPGNNVIVPPGGEHVISDLIPERLPVNVTCDIHRWMKAWIGVFDHPYFAITNEDGEFEIKNAPAGQYRLIAWQESVGWLFPGRAKGEEITIKDGGATEQNILMPPQQPAAKQPAGK